MKGRAVFRCRSLSSSGERLTIVEPCFGEGADNHQQGCETGWNVIGDVVDASSPTAKVTIAVGSVANHGVERVHHLVRQHARRPQQHEPEERGDDAIGEVLSQSLECRRANLLSRKLRGVAPNNA